MCRISIKKDPRYRIDNKKVRKIARKILAENKLEGKIELGIAFVGKRKAKELNQEYRRMGYLPEVLSFTYGKGKTQEGWRFLGDVVICFPALRERAITQNQLVEESVADLLRHGINNLLQEQGK